MLVMGKSESECLCLIKDVKTRWNYTCLMYERAIQLEPALILAMRNCYDNIGVEFTAQDFQLMKKLVRVLKPFADATKILSYNDSSISMVIPIVFTIKLGLKTKEKDDFGVITLKKALLKNLETRLGHLEEREEYFLATYLDPRFKWYFFSKSDTREKCKRIILSKLQKPSDDLSESVASSNSSVSDENLNDSFDQKMKNIIKSQQKSQNSKVNTDSCMAQEYVDKYDQANAIDSKGSSLHYWKNEHDTRHPVALLMSKLACYYLTPPPTSHLL